jgi:hypothetical protein
MRTEFESKGIIEHWLDRLFECRVIPNCDRDTYLFRWYIFKTKRITLFVHKFIRSDEDRCLHDHPWNFLVIPIWQGYIEHSDYICPCFMCQNHPTMAPHRIAVKRRVWPIIGSRFRFGTYRHRVELIEDKPSWSLFFHFSRFRDWGFWMPEGFVKWAKFWQDKCE